MTKDNKTTKEMDQDLKKLIKHLWNEVLEGKPKSIFFQTSGFNEINLNLQEEYILKENPTIFRQTVFKDTLLGPYFPFLDFFKTYFKQMNHQERLSDLIEEANVYHFQKQLFSTYLLDKKISRQEELILEELYYEKSMIMQSLLNMYSVLTSKEPIIFIIEQAHLLKPSSLDWIQYMLKKASNMKILFIFTYCKKDPFDTEVDREAWEKFIEFIEEEALVLQYKKDDFHYLKDIKEEQHKEKDLQAYLEASENCLQFLALQECREYVTAAYNEKMASNIFLSSESFTKMLYILGEVHHYLEENDTALLYFDVLLNFVQTSNSGIELAKAYERIGYIYLKKHQIHRAERLARQSMKLARQAQDDTLLMRAYFLQFLIGDKGRRQTLSQWKKNYDRLIELAQKLRMKNTLSYICTNPYGIFSEFREEYTVLHDMGIRIAKKYNNEHRLATAYHAKGMMHAIKGNYDAVLEYYQKSKKIKLQLENVLGLAQIYNGLGFYYYLTGQYEQANCHYHKALNLLKIEKDYHEIINTLHNIGSTLFLALQPKSAVKYLEKLLTLLSILKMKETAYHSRFGLYALIGVNYCQAGNLIKAYEYVTKIKMKELKAFPQKNEEYFLFELLQASICTKEKEYEKADLYYKRAEKYLYKANDVIKYFIPMFCYEYGKMLKAQGNSLRAHKVLQQGLRFCKELRYGFYHSVILREIDPLNNLIPSMLLNEIEMDFQWIMESAKQEVTINKLHKKIIEVNFLNILQNIIVEEKSKEKLICRVIELIDHNFFGGYTCLYLYEMQRWRNFYEVQSPISFAFDIETILGEAVAELLQELKKKKQNEAQFKITIIDEWYLVFIPLIMDDQLTGMMVHAVEKGRSSIASDDIKIFCMAAQQMATGLGRIEKDHELVQKNKELFEAGEYDRLKTEFFSNLSHELRTPLNVLLGSLQVFKAHLQGQQHAEEQAFYEANKYIRIMQQNCFRLVRLVNNLIDITRIDAGFFELHMEYNNIVEVIEDITLSVVPYIESKGIAVIFDTEIEEKVMLCDVDQLERIMLNLLSNAVKFTNEGGQVFVNIYDHEDEITISIEDTGIGIPRDKLDLIFERFRQVDKSLTRNHEGSGIGLSLVKSLVEMAGGRIKICSEYGKGSTFFITFPIKSQYVDLSQNKKRVKNKQNQVERISIEFSDIYLKERF